MKPIFGILGYQLNSHQRISTEDKMDGRQDGAFKKKGVVQLM